MQSIMNQLWTILRALFGGYLSVSGTRRAKALNTLCSRNTVGVIAGFTFMVFYLVALLSTPTCESCLSPLDTFGSLPPIQDSLATPSNTPLRTSETPLPQKTPDTFDVSDESAFQPMLAILLAISLFLLFGPRPGSSRAREREQFIATVFRDITINMQTLRTLQFGRPYRVPFRLKCQVYLGLKRLPTEELMSYAQRAKESLSESESNESAPF